MSEWFKDIAALEALCGTPAVPAVTKVADRLTPEYRAWTEASPFCALAMSGAEGLDCSPRGDDGPVVEVLDDAHLALPDRRGNNRIDSLRNIVEDPCAALRFLNPGAPTVIRVNGTARVTADPQTLERFTIHNAPPRSVIVVRIEALYDQCARAVMRGKLWDGGITDAARLPTPGTILEAMTDGFDAKTYDDAWPARAAKSMW